MGLFASGYDAGPKDPNEGKPGYTFSSIDGLFHDAAWFADQKAKHPGATFDDRLAKWVTDDTLSGREGDIGKRGTSDLNDQMANNLANESRDAQLAGLSMQQAAAMGNGPSAAAAQQAQMGGQGLLSSLAGHSMGGASQGLSGVAQQAAATRTNEMNSALAAYGEGAGQLRGGDQNYQQGAQNLSIKQRGLNLSQVAQNQSQIQGMEQARYNNDVAALAMQRQRAGLQASQTAARKARDSKIISGTVGAVAGVVTGGIGGGVASGLSDAVQTGGK
jgi:hypothetical protein